MDGVWPVFKGKCMFSIAIYSCAVLLIRNSVGRIRVIMACSWLERHCGQCLFFV